MSKVVDVREDGNVDEKPMPEDVADVANNATELRPAEHKDERINIDPGMM